MKTSAKWNRSHLTR